MPASAVRLTVGLLLSAAAGFAAAQEQAPEYAELESWLCHPDSSDDACDRDLSTTVIQPDGGFERLDFRQSDNRPIDCFYVYPTTSLDETGNSDLNPGEQGEIITAHLQTARLRKHCRVFAPIYRQITIPALRSRIAGEPMEMDREMTYADVLDAWNHYLEHENDGRGFVLVGHSQGAGLLNQLIANEIDGQPIQEQLVSAVISGSSVQVPAGETAGGTFQHIPICESAEQTGCVLSFSSYRDRIPPPENGMFARADDGNDAVCTNPAALDGGKAELDVRLSTIGEISTSFGEYKPWVESGREVETPFVNLPGKVYGECVEKDNFHYLEISVEDDSDDSRLEDIVGDLWQGGEINPAWGLHLIDMSLVMGDLVELIGQQGRAYAD